MQQNVCNKIRAVLVCRLSCFNNFGVQGAQSQGAVGEDVSSPSTTCLLACSCNLYADLLVSFGVPACCLCLYEHEEYGDHSTKSYAWVNLLLHLLRFCTHHAMLTAVLIDGLVPVCQRV